MAWCLAPQHCTHSTEYLCNYEFPAVYGWINEGNISDALWMETNKLWSTVIIFRVTKLDNQEFISLFPELN